MKVNITTERDHPTLVIGETDRNFNPYWYYEIPDRLFTEYAEAYAKFREVTKRVEHATVFTQPPTEVKRP